MTLVCSRRCGLTWGCQKRGLVPESGVAPWVAKPLEGGTAPPNAWMIISLWFYKLMYQPGYEQQVRWRPNFRDTALSYRYEQHEQGRA
jgi:hypothetical protein